MITQKENRGWDTYSGAVVAAETEAEAKLIYPGSIKKHGGEMMVGEKELTSIRVDVESEHMRAPEWSWVVDPGLVTAEYLGEAWPGITGRMMVLASFHAG